MYGIKEEYKMLKTYQYRLYPSLYQKQILSIQFGHNRFVWNNTLNYLQGEYQKYLHEKINNPEIKQKFINLGDIIKRLPILKQEIEWLSLAHSQTLQATMKRLDLSFQMFFKKKGSHPKFKRKTDEQSIEFPQQAKIDFDLKCIKLPKLGYTKITLDRTFHGTIKTCYVKKNKINQYFVSFVVDDGLAYPETNVFGDLGIKDLVITSKGEKIPNNKFLKRNCIS